MANATTSPTIVSRVAEQIQRDILNGTYPPGASLPEIPLGRRLDVSRSVIREALRGLTDSGLVVLSPRHGAIVSPVSPQLVHEVFSLRALLEAFALKLGMTNGRMHGDAAAAVEQAYESLAAAANSSDKLAIIEADMAFHWAVCQPCGHELLLEHLKQLQARTRLCILYTKLYRSDAESEALSHRPILNAIRAGEADRAELALRDHVIGAGQRLLVQLVEQEKLKPAGRGRSRIKVIA
mgnify:CR=1 FL=1|jgi:DNA-binding GntR family transcriptional regulator